MSETTELPRAAVRLDDIAAARPAELSADTRDRNDDDNRGRPEIVIAIAVVASVSLIFGFLLGLLF
jgi:hypothetical protein